MSSSELRNKVYKELEFVDDYLLEEILGLIEMEGRKEEVIKIPEHFKDALEKSIAQKKSGNTIPNTEVEKSIEEWLYK